MKASLLVIRNQLSCFCGPRDGGKYDLSNACPVCGSGARRIGAIKLPSARLKDSVSITLKHEVVIPPRLVTAIKAVSPQCLREITDEGTGVATPFFQLIPEMTLPKWSSATNGWCMSEMDPPCPTCKRDGFFNIPNTPLKLVYYNAMPPFMVAETYEQFGKSRLQPDFKKSIFAVPFLVVGETVQNALAGECGVDFLPVRTDGNQ